MTRGSALGVVLVAMVAMSAAGCAGWGAAGSADPSDFAEIPGIGATRVDVPRPTSPDGADCTLNLPADKTIEERATALRGLGLFAGRATLSDAALVEAVRTEIEAVWGSDIKVDDPFMELLVAERDSDRVWWHDLEADVVDENQVYVSTLGDWAAISVGAFKPSEITETWASDSGPVTVAFSLGGEAHELHPQYLEDWIDPTILGSINELIAKSGRRLEIVKAFDQTAFVMALTKAERAGLESRGWCFE
jgi:hypothetical protein